METAVTDCGLWIVINAFLRAFFHNNHLYSAVDPKTQYPNDIKIINIEINHPKMMNSQYHWIDVLPPSVTF